MTKNHVVVIVVVADAAMIVAVVVVVVVVGSGDVMGSETRCHRRSSWPAWRRRLGRQMGRLVWSWRAVAVAAAVAANAAASTKIKKMSAAACC